MNSLTWTLCRHRPLTVQQLPANPAAPCNRSPVKCLLRCTVCIFNRNSNPLTFLQLNFQAPKPTLTPKPMRIRTGLSINLPRSWTRPALKSSGWLEQVSFCLRLSALAVWVTSLSHISNWQPNIYTLSRDTACMLRVLIVQLRRGREGGGGFIAINVHLNKAASRIPHAEKSLPQKRSMTVSVLLLHVLL